MAWILKFPPLNQHKLSSKQEDEVGEVQAASSLSFSQVVFDTQNIAYLKDGYELVESLASCRCVCFVWYSLFSFHYQIFDCDCLEAKGKRKEFWFVPRKKQQQKHGTIPVLSSFLLLHLKLF